MTFDLDWLPHYDINVYLEQLSRAMLDIELALAAVFSKRWQKEWWLYIIFSIN